jgi:hypothetical protein
MQHKQKWIPLPLKSKNKYEISTGAMLPRYECKQRSYPVLDSLYKTIKSILVKSGNQYKRIDFEDEKTASAISEIMVCIIFNLLT